MLLIKTYSLVPYFGLILWLLDLPKQEVVACCVGLTVILSCFLLGMVAVYLDDAAERPPSLPQPESATTTGLRRLYVQLRAAGHTRYSRYRGGL